MLFRSLWVSSLGSSAATVYSLKASGNVAPLRTIRSRPPGTVSLGLGKTEAVAYDSRREELLVPNCVTRPQIAAFPRLGKENTPPTRVIAGQKTLISRTMHKVDECVPVADVEQLTAIYEKVLELYFQRFAR